MGDQEIRLVKRKKSALLKTIEKNVFAVIDDSTKQKDEAAAADDPDELIGLMKTIDDAVGELKLYNDKIYELTEDDAEMEKEMDGDMTMNRKINKYRALLEKATKVEKPAPAAATIKSPDDESKPPSRRAKVPDLKIPTFDGSYLEWDTFKETFDAIIGKKSEYSNVEKFQYLKSYLTGSAKQCVAGFPVTGANYDSAYKLLEERFGNEHLVIQAHMRQITKMRSALRGTGAELRKVLDTIQSHVRSLEAKGVNKKHFGALLIPTIQERIPADVDLLISRQMGKESWNIDDYLRYLQAEVEARESCKTTDRKPQVQDSKNDENSAPGNVDEYTVQTLVAAALQLQKGGVKLDNKPKITKPKKGLCGFCKGDHYSDKCSVVCDFKKRVEVVKANELCPKCLKHGHALVDCKSTKNCYSCKSIKHHTALCNPNGTDLCLLTKSKRSPVVLQTASIEIGDVGEKKMIRVNVIFDSCSQRTYVTERVVSELCLLSIGADEFNIGSFAASRGKRMNLNEYKLVMKTNGGTNFYLDAWRVPTICSSIKNRVRDAVDAHPFLRDLPLASDDTNDHDEIDVLIGADFYWRLVDGETKQCDESASDIGFRAISSKFGWMLSGPLEARANEPEFQGYSTFVTNAESYGKIDHEEDNHTMVATSDDVDEKDELSSNLKNFFDLDLIGIRENERSVEERIVADIKFEQGRFETALPRKEYAPPLESNYAIAKAHVIRTRTKQSKTPYVLEEYDRTIREWEANGIIERVSPSAPTSPGNVTYLTHRAVERGDKTTTKIRPVFNASLRGRNGVSLNDCLHKGPCMNPKLFDSWVKFRSHSTAISADIEKAYLQIGVRPEDRDLMRFLWFEDGFDGNSSVVTYRFTRVFFGATCSQFLLSSTLHKIAETYDETDAEFARKVRDHFYVDDLNTGAESTKGGIETYETMKSRFSSANFNLRKWRTNNKELQQHIDRHEPKDTTATPDSAHGKVLGIEWNETTDELVISVKDLFPTDVCDVTPTKRNVLRVIAGIWDIVGFLQPVIVRLKLLFMQICTTSLEWDDEITGELRTEWDDILRSKNEIEELRIPRCYNEIDRNDPVVRRELHGFSDASTVVYGACIYLKSIRKSGKIDIRFVAAKSRVAAPKKSKKGQSIPRLELLGNLVLCRLMSVVRDALETEIDIDDSFYWSDSLVSLGWIKSWKKELNTFCQNRVTEIRNKSDMDKWNYVNTKENPADIITRQNSMNVINHVTWLEPPFLQGVQTKEPIHLEDDVSGMFLVRGVRERFHVEEEDFLSEVKIETAHVHVCTDRPEQRVSNVLDPDTFNSSFKLFRVTALVLRFINNMKRKIMVRKENGHNKTRSSPRFEKEQSKIVISIPELRAAKRLWLKDNQITLQQSEQYNELKNALKITPDDNGILRSTCKLMNTSLPYSAKAPIVLSRQHRLTEMLVWETHRTIKHMSVKQTLSEMRNQYWIPRGRGYIRMILHKCVTCKRVNARPYPYPSISNIPSFRARDDVPFSAIGVDYAGPLLCKNVFGGKGTLFKCWIALYTFSMPFPDWTMLRLWEVSRNLFREGDFLST